MWSSWPPLRMVVVLPIRPIETGKSMRLVCISDTHNQHKGISLPEGDVLIHAGDATGNGDFREIASFLSWFESRPHPNKILIAGNHDWGFEREPDITALLLKDHPGITYLQDSGCRIGGVRFWGSPWQPWFCDWAFNLPRNGARIREKWNLIPVETDVLVTHGPPHGVLDNLMHGGRAGCEELTIRLASIHPKVHVFGHIHWGYGQRTTGDTTYINASICDESYRPVNAPIVFDL